MSEQIEVLEAALVVLQGRISALEKTNTVLSPQNIELTFITSDFLLSELAKHPNWGICHQPLLTSENNEVVGKICWSVYENGVHPHGEEFSIIKGVGATPREALKDAFVGKEWTSQ